MTKMNMTKNKFNCGDIVTIRDFYYGYGCDNIQDRQKIFKCFCPKGERSILYLLDESENTGKSLIVDYLDSTLIVNDMFYVSDYYIYELIEFRDGKVCDGLCIFIEEFFLESVNSLNNKLLTGQNTQSVKSNSVKNNKLKTISMF